MENNLKRRTSKTTRQRQLTTLTTTGETDSSAASRQTTSYAERRTRSASTAAASSTATEPMKAGERLIAAPRSATELPTAEPPATELSAEELPAEDRATEDRAAEEVPHVVSTPARSSAGTRLAAGTRSPVAPQPRSELVTASAASRASTSAVKREREPMTLAGLLKLLADDHRLAIIELLKSQPELNVGEFCEMLSQSQPAVSHHLAQLRRAGLLESRRSGKHRFYRIRRRGWREVEMLLSGLLFDANSSLRRPVPSLVGAD